MAVATSYPSNNCAAMANSYSGNHRAVMTSYPSNNCHAPMTNSSYTSNHMAVATSYPSNNCAAMANSYSGNHRAVMTSYPSNNCHAPMTNSSYTNDHMAVATSYPSNNCAAMANSYSGNRTAVMTSYPSNNCHAAMAESSYFGNHMVVATSSPSNDTAVSTSYNSNDHHELSNSFNSGYDYHAVDSNMMAAAFLSQDINACTNLPPTSGGFTQGLPPLPPPQFFQKEQQLISTAHDSQMIGCYGDTDLILNENLNDHAPCNSLPEFTVASSTLVDTNTVPVFQSENDPRWMIHHNNYLDHAAEDVGSDCGVIMGTGMELVNSTSPPSVRDGDLIMTPMQASGGGGGGGGGPGAYLLTDQFDVCSFNPLWEVVGGNQRSRTTHLG
ncbi:hypothetical protein Ancab_000603 [Ancistrocladus abbreviatus]